MKKKTKCSYLELVLVGGAKQRKYVIDEPPCVYFDTLFVLIFARTNFPTLAQKINLRAKFSTEFALKRGVREN